jgi:zinc protease
MPIVKLLLSFCLGCCLLSNFADSQGPAWRKTAEVEGVSEYVLTNGCRVVLIPDDSASSITVNMTVLVGSRHEGYGESGMAHLLEHMLFKGTPLHADLDKELKERGVIDMNGTTDYDRTNYYETLPASAENLDWAISIEADRLVNCYIRGEDLFSEMTVVRNEFESGEDSPESILMQRIMANAYEWHNYGKSVIGNRADIERVPVNRLRAFYKKYYRPDNVVLLVAGRFDPETALASAASHFGSLDKPNIPLEST